MNANSSYIYIYLIYRPESSSISDSGMDSDTNLSSSFDILPDMGYGKIYLVIFQDYVKYIL